MMGLSLNSKRPAGGTSTGLVWEIADRISQQIGRCAPRKDVIAAVVGAGGNGNTASTQYSAWKKSWQPTKGDSSIVATSTGSVVLQMGRDGRVLVPQAFRIALGIDDLSKLSARIENGELRIAPQKLAFARLQALVKAHDKGEGSVVDELLSDRRLEASQP